MVPGEGVRRLRRAPRCPQGRPRGRARGSASPSREVPPARLRPLLGPARGRDRIRAECTLRTHWSPLRLLRILAAAYGRPSPGTLHDSLTIRTGTARLPDPWRPDADAGGRHGEVR